MSKNEQIKTINISEHIRFRPAMYVGSTDKVGMHYLIIGIMRLLCEQTNSKIKLVVDLSNQITVLKLKGTIINQMVNSDAEKTLVGLTGKGQKFLDAQNAYLFTALFSLSSYIKVNNSKGDLIVLKEGKFDFNPKNMVKEDWLNFHFILDNKIFGNHSFSKSIMSAECEKLAALNKNVQIELLDNRNGCNYQEKFTMENGLIQLFTNKLDQLNSYNYDSYQSYATSPNFHIKIKEPELYLELVFMISNQDNTFEKSYYTFLDLTNGGSHISYLKMKLKQLNEKLNSEFDSYNNDLNSYNFMSNIETKHPFPFAGPTKTRIEDPMLVQIMKSAFDKLKPKIISFFEIKYAKNPQ